MKNQGNNTTETLIQKLTEETRDLKDKYIEVSSKWAQEEFKRYSESTLVYQYKNGKFFAKQWGKTRKEEAQIQRMLKALNQGIENYIKSVEVDSEKHYHQSISKLAFRVVDRGLDMSKLNISTDSRIEKGNISTTISDGKVSLRAFTILAWGSIQRPHYRYLIK